MAKDIAEFLKDSIPEFKKAIPPHLVGKYDLNYALRNCITTIRTTPNLNQMAKKNPSVFLPAILRSISLGLLIGSNSLAQCSLVVRGGNAVDIMITARGLETSFFQRGGKQLRVEEVKEKDHFKIIQGTESPRIEHEYPSDDRGETKGWYAVAINAMGQTQFCYATVGELEEHRDNFSPNSKVWKDPRFFKSMCRKPMVIRICREVSYSNVAFDQSFPELVGTAEYHSRGVSVDSNHNETRTNNLIDTIKDRKKVEGDAKIEIPSTDLSSKAEVETKGKKTIKARSSSQSKQPQSQLTPDVSKNKATSSNESLSVAVTSLELSDDLPSNPDDYFQEV